MRILKVTQAYYPFVDAGGPAVKVRAIARALAGRGHRVTVLTADLGLGLREGRAAIAEPSRWRRQTQEHGVEAIYLSTVAQYRAATLNPGLLRFCRERLRTFSLVHIYGLYDLLGPVVANFCRRRIPYVLEPMGMFRPIVRSIRLKRIYHWLLGQKLLRGARRLIATSERERRELVEGGIPEAKVIVRRNGVEIPNVLPVRGSFRQRWGISPEAKVVLFLGRLVSKKSPDLLLEAFAEWRRERGQYRAGAILLLAGPDEGNGYRRRLQTLATRLGLDGAVLFTGPLYDEAKWAAYQDADLFVLPSQNENFGNAAAEAVVCGTPVLVTDRCGIAPLVNQRAGLVVPYDGSELQAGLRRFFRDEPLRQRLRAGCREVTHQLSWDEPLAQMETLYAELVAESPRI